MSTSLRWNGLAIDLASMCGISWRIILQTKKQLMTRLLCTISRMFVISADYCQKMIANNPQRIEAVIKA